jgi:hypothetical protein
MKDASMRRFTNYWIALIVPAALCLPGSAQAQVRAFGAGYFGSFGGYGYGYGGYGFGNMGGYGYFGGYMAPGYAAPYGALPMPGSAYGYNSGSTYGMDGYGSSSSGAYAGFSASPPVHVRSTAYPAIAKPSRAAIAAALEGKSHFIPKVPPVD